ncbi:MAG: hypothetical protein KDK62_00960 [Chlamydiia bacterium]|nr:hypothetical protein [Chlamydiia bacterium]
MIQEFIREFQESCHEISQDFNDLFKDEDICFVIELIARVSLASFAALATLFTLGASLIYPTAIWIIIPVGVVITISLLITLAFTFVNTTPQIPYPK